MKRYEAIEHTADIGLRIFGKDWPELLSNAALGLFDLMTDVAKINTSVTTEMSVDAADREALFLGWLRELLFLFSTKRYVLKEFDFKELTDKTLKVTVRGEIFDPKRHDQKLEVKAVTYHRFKLEKRKKGWAAEVLFDV
ncbi:MAG TPA: archease [bacterium]|nr:archease [bacterium]